MSGEGLSSDEDDDIPSLESVSSDEVGQPRGLTPYTRGVHLPERCRMVRFLSRVCTAVEAWRTRSLQAPSVLELINKTLCCSHIQWVGPRVFTFLGVYFVAVVAIITLLTMPLVCNHAGFVTKIVSVCVRSVVGQETESSHFWGGVWWRLGSVLA